jgi:hypothetical protein
MMVPLLRERLERPGAVLLIGFEEREGESLAMLDEMKEACLTYGVRVQDRMVVRDGRWFDLDCQKSCCPPEGLLLPAPSEVAAVAEFVGREICPLPDRSALADLLEPGGALSSSQLAAVSRLAGQWSQLREEALNAGRSETCAGARGLRPWERELREMDTGLREMDDELREMDDELRGFRANELGDADTGLRELDTGLYGFRANEFRDVESGPRELDAGLGGFRANELAVWARVLCDKEDAEPIRELPPQDLAMLAASLTDVDLRDGLIAWLCPGTLPQDLIDPILMDQMTRTLPEPRPVGDDGGVDEVISRQRIERRLCELSAALPDGWAVPVLTVLASFTWSRGDGALTRVALGRALRVDPHYRLAQLLERMVDLAIRPEGASA